MSCSKEIHKRCKEGKRFESEGIKANVILKGLGEYEEFGNLYIDRINDVINGTYKGLGETKKKKHRREMK